ncbi:hypothetical protein RHMOL_Rhmol05G0134700 [Rhododendron molle]|uniref:Uncharacterized protein n=1 Tax=Rhododendron molle TaxID=49168 RepID=A0ACC0NQR1_RHOML|nr:hypothetical protein RHMOL_Rhmol05G0134700 [Rhododendron molle]
MKACDQIDTGTHKWKLELLDTMLHPENAGLVQAIPLSNSDMEDRYVWHFSSQGMYTVSSGYETTLTLKWRGRESGRGGGGSGTREADKKCVEQDMVSPYSELN